MIKIQQAITFKQETHYTRMGAGVDLMLLLNGHSVYSKDIYIFRRGILEKIFPKIRYTIWRRSELSCRHEASRNCLRDHIVSLVL